MWRVALVVLAGCGRGFFNPMPPDGGGTIDTPPAPVGNLAFVTSMTTSGNFGGASGADQFCQQAATASDLPGTYVALLSTSTTNAVSRLAGSRGWQRVDGQPIADLPSQIGNLLAWYPLSLDETGHDTRPVNASVWTGTEVSGGSTGNDTCGDWTLADSASMGVIGASDAAGSANLSDNFDGCNSQARLYCFGVGVHPVSAPAPIAGRLAFISSSRWVPNAGGVASADALCQAEAVAANRTGTFVAALPTTTATTASRFDTTGAVWVRADGVPLVATAADMFGATFAHTAFAMTLDGQAVGSRAYWAGDPNALAASKNNCMDWTAPLAPNPGEIGDADETSPFRWSFSGPLDGYSYDACNVTGHGVLCLEQ